MRKHLNLIQLSRAVVPLFVILFHAEDFMAAYFNYDFLHLSSVKKSGGVYYFFALSGFMIYYLYHKEFGNRKILKHYLLSRISRIYPFYWVLSICILPVYFVVPNFGSGDERDIGTIISSLLLMPTQNEPIIGVAWSLVHTVFFYLVFSLAFFTRKWASHLALIVWALFSIAFSVNIISSNHYLLNFLFNFNNLIFLSGIGCAYLITRLRFNYLLSLVMIIIGFAGFPLSWLNTQHSFIDISFQFSTGCASILLIVGLASIDMQKDIRLPRLIKYLGDASFSIYLTNFITMSAVSKLLSSVSDFPMPNMLVGMSLMLLAIIVGCLVYSFIEKPMAKRINQIIRTGKEDSNSLVKKLPMKKAYLESKMESSKEHLNFLK
ncbi:MAG: acyltransferase [Neobacillus sp.]